MQTTPQPVIMPDYTPGRRAKVYDPIKPLSKKATIFGKEDNDPVSIVDPVTKVAWTYNQKVIDDRLIRRKNKNSCWGWLGPFHRQGFGLIWVKREHEGIAGAKNGMMNVQRLMMAIHLDRPLTKSERVTSTAHCNNKCCTNPAHLSITDYKHQHQFVDFSYAFKGRKRRYNEDFFLQYYDVIDQLGPVGIEKAIGLPKGRGHTAKYAFRKWQYETGQVHQKHDVLESLA